MHLNLAYRWFCRLGLDGAVPDYSTFSKNRHGRFRDCDLLRRREPRRLVHERGIEPHIPVFETSARTDGSFSLTDANLTSRRERKEVEMLFAHLKRILRL